MLQLLLALLPAANAQSVTGQISGNVADSSGGALVGAAVYLTHDISQQERSFNTGSTGSFIFTNLVPGAYSIKISMTGFKNYEQRAIPVAAQERVDLHEIRLSVGDVSCTVEVLASAVHVATDSSDRSISIGLAQIADTPTRGRNPVSMIMTLPALCSHLPISRPRRATSVIAIMTLPVSASVAQGLFGNQAQEGPKI